MIGALWQTLFYEPILNGLLILYSVLGENLGFAIIVLTLVLRVMLFPLMKSQYESSRKLKQIQPLMEQLKKKYPKNPKKVQEEQVKLYRSVGYNPLGCLVSTLVPFPFLIAIYQVIRAFSSGTVWKGVYSWVAPLIHWTEDAVVNTRFLGLELSDSYLPLAKDHGYVTLWVLPYLLLALLVGLSQYFSVKFNQTMMGGAPVEGGKEADEAKKKKNGAAPDMSSMMGDMNKSMMITFPLMTTVISLSLPAAVSLYWILQSWIPVLLYLLSNKLAERRNANTKEK